MVGLLQAMPLHQAKDRDFTMFPTMQHHDDRLLELDIVT